MVFFEPEEQLDPYIDPKTNCFKNRLGIDNEAQLKAVTATLSSLRQQELRYNPIGGEFDLKHLQAIHKHLYKDVYDWAGELRTVNLSEGGLNFDNKNHIEHYVSSTCDQFHRTFDLNSQERLSRDDFSKQMGDYMANIYGIYPFRAGNEETMCALVDQIAHQQHYSIAWSEMNLEKVNQEIQNCRIVFNNHYEGELDYHLDGSELSHLLRDHIYEKNLKPMLDLIRSTNPNIGKIECEYAKPDGIYQGPLLGITDKYIVQYQLAKPEEVILHKKHALTPSPHYSDHDRSQVLEIRYPRSEIGLVSVKNEVKHDKDLPVKSLFFDHHDHER